MSTVSWGGGSTPQFMHKAPPADQPSSAASPPQLPAGPQTLGAHRVSGLCPHQPHCGAAWAPSQGGLSQGLAIQMLARSAGHSFKCHRERPRAHVGVHPQDCHAGRPSHGRGNSGVEDCCPLGISTAPRKCPESCPATPVQPNGEKALQENSCRAPLGQERLCLEGPDHLSASGPPSMPENLARTAGGGG